MSAEQGAPTEGSPRVYAVTAEGGRIGLVACPDCGAVVMIEEPDPTVHIAAHNRYHDEGLP